MIHVALLGLWRSCDMIIGRPVILGHSFVTTCTESKKNTNPPPYTSGVKVIYKDVFSAGEIEIWYTNADSLQNKLNELKVLLQSQRNKPKVVAITEVKHKNKWHLSNSELQIDGYNLYTNDLSDNVRGVAIYVSDELSCN